MSDTLEDAATASTPATESTTSGSSVVEQSGTLVNKLMLEYTLFEDTNDQGITRSLLEGAEKTASDQKQGRTDGMKKFLDFNHTLSKQDAKRVKREHKVRRTRYPHHYQVCIELTHSRGPNPRCRISPSKSSRACIA